MTTLLIAAPAAVARLQRLHALAADTAFTNAVRQRLAAKAQRAIAAATAHLFLMTADQRTALARSLVRQAEASRRLDGLVDLLLTCTLDALKTGSPFTARLLAVWARAPLPAPTRAGPEMILVAGLPTGISTCSTSRRSGTSLVRCRPPVPVPPQT
jgi:hypothetical protein